METNKELAEQLEKSVSRIESGLDILDRQVRNEVGRSAILDIKRELDELKLVGFRLRGYSWTEYKITETGWTKSERWPFTDP